MLVKELPKDTNLTKVKVKLPPNVLELYQKYAGGDEEMWIAGGMMGDFFLTPQSPEIKGQKRLYPMPEPINPNDILEWEVVENLN